MATPSVVALVGGDAPNSALMPGGSSDVVLRIFNPNPYALSLTSISVNGSIAVSAASGTCTLPGVTTNFPSHPAITVPAGSSLVHLSGAALMSLGSQSGCQGATFTIPVSASFQK
jgi:P pilus assembly chaperone PapD